MNQSQTEALAHLEALGEQIFTFMETRITNAWKENGEPTAEKKEALDKIIQSYRTLYGFHLDMAKGASAYELFQKAVSLGDLFPAVQLPTTAPYEAEVELVNCWYCDGEGATGFQLALEGEGTRIPCQACGGAGKVPKEEQRP